MPFDFAPELPESVAEIADVIGREKALEWIGSLPRCGSRKWRKCVYVPKRLDRVDHPLVRALGWEDANKVVRAFSGMILQPSNCRFIARGIRNQRILEMDDAGIPIKDIAIGVDLSRRQVKEIIEKGREPLQ